MCFFISHLNEVLRDRRTDTSNDNIFMKASLDELRNFEPQNPHFSQLIHENWSATHADPTYTH